MTTETKATHTPGPWKVLPVGNQWGIVRKAAKRGEDDICGGSVYHDDWKANAALIAAAPDLLDALKAVVAVADRDTAEFAAARAAIARAEGRK